MFSRKTHLELAKKLIVVNLLSEKVECAVGLSADFGTAVVNLLSEKVECAASRVLSPPAA